MRSTRSPSTEVECAGRARGSMLDLAPEGVYRVSRDLSTTRWSLTPPFHPYPDESRRSVFCGTFLPAGYGPRYPRLSPGLPALRSPDFPPRHHAEAETRRPSTADAEFKEFNYEGSSMEGVCNVGQDEFRLMKTCRHKTSRTGGCQFGSRSSYLEHHLVSGNGDAASTILMT